MSSITESVYASGKVTAVGQYNVNTTVSGILKKILVESGEEVKAGDTLFVLENQASELSSKNALALLELSRENAGSGSDLLRELALNVSLAKEKLNLDSSLFERQKSLWNQKIGSQLDFDQRRMTYLASQKALEVAQVKLSQAKRTFDSDAKRAAISYDLTKENSNDFVVRSLIDGKVYDVMVDANQLITPQTLLAVVGNSNHYILKLEVDEYDIVKILPGQKIFVTMDSHKGSVFEAEVLKTNPLMNERSRTFTIDAEFVKPPDVLLPNLTVEANIVLTTKDNAMTIPSNYLVEGKYVYTSEKEKIEVQTGLRDLQKVEILGGLSQEQKIFLPPAQ